jgi:hypothetical protein
MQYSSEFRWWRKKEKCYRWGHVVHERPEETCKAARNPKKSIKQLNSASELSVSLKAFKEKQSGDNDSVQSVNVDWNKVKVTSKVYSDFSVFTQSD